MNELPRATIIGCAEEGSKKSQERTDRHVAALDAVSRGDLDAMFAAYRESVEDRAEAETLFMQSIGMLHKRDLTPNEASPIEAIRDVALAAIALAEKVATNSG